MYSDHKTEDFLGLFSICLFHVYAVYINCNHFMDYKAKLHYSDLQPGCALEVPDRYHQETTVCFEDWKNLVFFPVSP